MLGFGWGFTASHKLKGGDHNDHDRDGYQVDDGDFHPRLELS